jgi:hypothetical protein
VNERAPGVTETGEAPFPEFTFKTTGNVVDVLPAVTVRNVAYVPTARDPGFAEIDRACGVVPAGGTTLSQVAAGNTLVVNATLPVVDVTVTGWAGAATPACVLNVSVVDGLNVKLLVVV